MNPTPHLPDPHRRRIVRAALAAGRGLGLPVVVTLAPPGPGELRLPSGVPAADALRALAGAGAVAVGVNCALPGAPLAELAASLPDLGVPLVVKPSAGLPGSIVAPEAFAAWVAEAARAGAAWVGGCCGATPAHLAAVAIEHGAVLATHDRGFERFHDLRTVDPLA